MSHSQCFVLCSIYAILRPLPETSNNAIRFPRHEKACNPKQDQPSRNAPKPRQTVLGALARDQHIHTPHAADDIHRKNDGAHDGELAEDIGVFFRALVHADVDLGDVVAVGSA